MAEADEVMTNEATQDILHYIELHDNSYHTSAKLAKKLKGIREARRKAKDTAFVLGPVVDWENSNAQAIRSLERLLGDVRKNEKHIQQRIYNPRTKITEDIENVEVKT